MKSWISLILISLLITSSSFAEDAIYLEKDQKSPYSGVLMPESKVIELRNNTLENNTRKLQIDSLNTSVNLLEDIVSKKTEQVGILLDQNDKLSKTAFSERNLNNWEKAGWFVAGLFVAYASVKVGQAVLK